VNIVKNFFMIQGTIAALFFISTVVVAEDKYPASDFQPKVVYQDEEVGKSSASSSASPSAPASQSSSSDDSQFPAANFQPKVLYSDDKYQHSEPAYKSSSSTESSSSNVTDGSSASTVPAAQKEDSSVGYLVGLIVLVAAGFMLYKKGALGSIGAASASSRPASPGGLTGVGKYILRTSGTGVSRYIEKHTKSAAASSASSVAKYLARQSTSAKSAGEGQAAATGVEKYLRNKG
jgi:hypothetical protein